jgi:hypothetical protein
MARHFLIIFIYHRLSISHSKDFAIPRPTGEAQRYRYLQLSTSLPLLLIPSYGICTGLQFEYQLLFYGITMAESKDMTISDYRMKSS